MTKKWHKFWNKTDAKIISHFIYVYISRQDSLVSRGMLIKVLKFHISYFQQFFISILFHKSPQSLSSYPNFQYHLCSKQLWGLKAWKACPVSRTPHSNAREWQIQILYQMWWVIKKYSMTITSHEWHGISNHWHLNSLFKSLLSLTAKKTQKQDLPFVKESTSDQWIPQTKGQLCWEYFHVMIVSWLYDLPQLFIFMAMIISGVA